MRCTGRARIAPRRAMTVLSVLTVILGASYPGAALVVGPVLIATPYAVARALSNRAVSLRSDHGSQTTP